MAEKIEKMAVKFHTDGSDFRLQAKGRAAEWICRAIREERFLPGAVNFIFCSPERHLEMNRRFLGHDYATDVITFDYSGAGVVSGGRNADGGFRISGDVFIDPVTVAGNAADLCVAPEVEMRRVMVHGVLHLCGYGDKTPGQQRVMRAREDHYLAKYYATI